MRKKVCHVHRGFGHGGIVEIQHGEVSLGCQNLVMIEIAVDWVPAPVCEARAGLLRQCQAPPCLKSEGGMRRVEPPDTVIERLQLLPHIVPRGNSSPDVWSECAAWATRTAIA